MRKPILIFKKQSGTLKLQIGGMKSYEFPCDDRAKLSTSDIKDIFDAGYSAGKLANN